MDNDRRVVEINGKLRFYAEKVLVKEATIPTFLHRVAKRLWEEKGVLPHTREEY